MRIATIFLGLAALGSASGLAGAQTLGTLVKQTDTIIGIGELTGITYVAINDSRTWTAVIDTSFSDNNIDGALLRNGFVTLREGATLFNPPGSNLDEWVSVSFTNNGNLGMLLQLKQGSTTVVGAFWNLVPVTLAGATGSEIVDPNVPVGSKWDRFNVIKLNPRNELFVLGDIVPPGSTARRATMIRYKLGPSGEILSYQALATKGMEVPALGSGVTVNTLGNTEHVIDVNRRGDFIVYIGGVGATGVLINMDTVAAQELLPSPVPGRNWKSLALTKVSINDRGDYICTGTLDGSASSNFLIVKTNQKFAQSGDVYPSLSLAPLDNGSAAPVIVANNGDVFWSPRFQGVSDAAFARNFEPIVQQNRTLVNGSLVTSITAGENGFAVSPNGRFFVGRVEVQGLGSTAVFVDYGLALELPGCEGNAGRLKLDSGNALVGHQFTLSLDNAQVPGAIPVLVFSSGPALPNSECGIHTAFGEVLFSPPLVRKFMTLPPWNGAPVKRTFNVPNDISLLDSLFFGQGVFVDPGMPSPEKYRMTNGLRIELGAP